MADKSVGLWGHDIAVNIALSSLGDLHVDVEISLGLAGGAEMTASATAFSEFIGAFDQIETIGLIVLLGRVWDATGRADYAAAIAHAEIHKDRMVLIEVDNGATDMTAQGLPRSKFASAYYPRGLVAMKNAAGETITRDDGLTGHIAGIIARIDAEDGPWAAPAGLRADVRGVVAPVHLISSLRHGDINDANVNALRVINGTLCVYGARTRDIGGQYAIMPVARSAMLIADSLRAEFENKVFHKNIETTWVSIKLGVQGFLTTLFAKGAFQGATPAEAFDVACGLGESMTQAEIDDNLLRVNVRYMPALMAEVIEIHMERKFDAVAA